MDITRKPAPHNNPNRDYEAAENVINRIMMFAPDYDSFTLHDLFVTAGFTTIEMQQATDNDAVELMLSDLKYVRQRGDGFMFQLTDLGRKVKESGGRFNYLKSLEEKAEVEAERQKLNDDKLKYDVKNAKRVFKTYWWTFWFSVVSIGYVFFQILMKLIEHFGASQNK